MVKIAEIPETFKFHLKNSVAFQNYEQYRPQFMAQNDPAWLAGWELARVEVG